MSGGVRAPCQIRFGIRVHTCGCCSQAFDADPFPVLLGELISAPSPSLVGQVVLLFSGFPSAFPPWRSQGALNRAGRCGKATQINLPDVANSASHNDTVCSPAQLGGNHRVTQQPPPLRGMNSSPSWPTPQNALERRPELVLRGSSALASRGSGYPRALSARGAMHGVFSTPRQE